MTPAADIPAAERREAFFALAARIFGVDRERLDANTSRDDLAEWDSINHLRLVMESERLFSTRMPLADIPGISALGDFIRALEK